MSAFAPPDITTDPGVLRADAKAFLAAELPGWRSELGSIEDVLIDAFSLPAAEQAEALEANLIAAYKSLGPLVKVEPIRAHPASGLATFTVADTAGHTLLASGTVVGLRTASNELRAFRLLADLTVAPGESTATGFVQDTEGGAVGNNLGGKAELIEAGEALLEVVVGTTGGGIDEETEAAFLDRLTEELAIQRPGPVLAADAAVIARSIAGVYRATAVDNLKPSAADGGAGLEEANVERCVTVSCVDQNGAPCSAEVMAEVDATLQALRETSFEFFVVKPHYTKIDVSCTVFAWPGADLATVKAQVQEALEEALSPARWAMEQVRRPQTWKNDLTVRQGILFAAVQNVAGVRWCSSLTFGKHGGALSTSDVTIGGGSAVPALPDVNGSADGTGTPATFTIDAKAST